MPNRLSREKSPYLLQHQHNPVDWYSWGDEAFQAAKQKNKPIFLSIGYSTCHWCHVMERESFENEKIAAIMNKYFVNIKVDREERPDVDKVYMSAVQTMTGQGGWPLSVFLTPDLTPFYGGTYFPPADGHGRPGFPTLLERINEVWQQERENVLLSGNELLKQLQHRHYIDSKNTQLDETILKRTYHQIAAGYDPKYSGFGSGTKFPRPVIFNFLFRYHRRTNDREALTMSLTSLMAMASGGMYDHLGGGFHRYSVDPQWRVPHFEKMLYDQAQLIHSFLDAYQLTKDEYFAGIARETLDYVLREMTAPEGGFYSAEDADSADPNDPGKIAEGAFYVWSHSEVSSLLEEREAELFCHHYSIEKTGNVHSDPHREFTGKNILFNPFTVEQTAAAFGMETSAAERLLRSARQKLLAARSRRPRPLLDDKILTSWNGLMIGASSRGARVLNEPRYAAAAVRAAERMFSALRHPADGKMFRRYRDGEVKYDAQLDDYAFLVSGLLELHESTDDLRWLEWAMELNGIMMTQFWDSSEAGFFDTNGKDLSIVVRMKESYDGAEPTGNSVAVMNLLKLYHRTNDESLKDLAVKTMKHFCTMLEQSPQIMPQLMAAVESLLNPPQHIVIVPAPGGTADLFTAEAATEFLPDAHRVVLTEQNRRFFVDRFPFMNDMAAREGRTTAFVCENYSCRLPVTDREEFGRLLKGLRKF